MKLFDRIQEAKKNLNLETKLIPDPEKEFGPGVTEEVTIGSDYIDKDSLDEDGVCPDYLGEGVIKEDVSPNDLDADDASIFNFDCESDEATKTEAPKYSDSNTTEDTSGKTHSFVNDFLEKYSDGDDVLQVLRYDLMKIIADIQWIKETNNHNEQFSLDFCDALNELSVSL
jgi:hypothetical protein